MDMVELAGLRIRYQRVGQGPPLVLLHGAYEDSRIWRRQLDALSDEFTVFAWDAPGCGGSDDPPPDFTGRDLGDALAGFLREAVPDRPHILGLSMGSVIALEFYRAYPSVPASLLLASAYAGWAGSLPPEEVERRYAQVLAELEQPPEQFIPVWLPTLFTEHADPAVVRETSAIMADFHPSGMRALSERERTCRLPRCPAHHRGAHAAAVRHGGRPFAAQRGPRDEPADPGFDARDDSRRRAHGRRRSARRLLTPRYAGSCTRLPPAEPG